MVSSLDTTVPIEAMDAFAAGAWEGLGRTSLPLAATLLALAGLLLVCLRLVLALRRGPLETDDEVFMAVRATCLAEAIRDPGLRQFLESSVIRHRCLEAILKHVICSRLANADMDARAWSLVIGDVLFDTAAQNKVASVLYLPSPPPPGSPKKSKEEGRQGARRRDPEDPKHKAHLKGLMSQHPSSATSLSMPTSASSSSNNSGNGLDQRARSLGDCIRLDLQACVDRDPACTGPHHPLLFFKGFLGLQCHRVAHVLWGRGRRLAALTMQARTSEVFGMDMHPAATIGAGVMIDHATGLVIGETAVVGDECSLFHGVTLGGTGKENGDRHPKLGKCVLVGANASILGNIRIGDRAKIGGGSVVLRAIPAGATAVGLPAKVIGRVAETNPGVENDTALNQVFVPQNSVDFRSIWKHLGKEAKGFLTPRKFHQQLKSTGLSTAQIDDLFFRLDKDGDGLLSEVEFSKNLHCKLPIDPPALSVRSRSPPPPSSSACLHFTDWHDPSSRPSSLSFFPPTSNLKSRLKPLISHVFLLLVSRPLRGRHSEGRAGTAASPCRRPRPDLSSALHRGSVHEWQWQQWKQRHGCQGSSGARRRGSPGAIHSYSRPAGPGHGGCTHVTRSRFGWLLHLARRGGGPHTCVVRESLAGHFRLLERRRQRCRAHARHRRPHLATRGCGDDRGKIESNGLCAHVPRFCFYCS